MENTGKSSQPPGLGWGSVTAVILAGGLGTRLRQVVSDRPKVLAEVHGRPFLTHLLERLADSGTKRVVLCTGHMGDQIEAAFGNSYRGMSLAYSKEATPLGTGGALRLALPLITSHCALVMNGDSLCAVNLSTLWARHQMLGLEGTVVLVKSSETGRYGKVKVDAAGKVISFEEKISSNGSGWINAGVYLLNRRLIEGIPYGTSCSLERDMFSSWVQQGLHGYKSTGPFLDIGTPESYGLAEAFLMHRHWRRQATHSTNNGAVLKRATEADSKAPLSRLPQ